MAGSPDNRPDNRIFAAMSNDASPEYDLQFVKGIGPRRAAVLAKYGINSIDDLIKFFPRKYVDRSTVITLNKLQPDQEVTVIGRIEAAGVRRARKEMFYIVITDDTGLLEAIWFNAAAYLKNVFKVGDWVSLSGKVSFYRGYQMVHPDYDRLGQGEMDTLLNTGKILAFYPGNEAFKRAGLNSYTFRRIFYHLQSKFNEQVDFFPGHLLSSNAFPTRAQAFKQIHLPDSNPQLDQAIYRFKYEDFFFLQLMMALQKAHIKSTPKGFAYEKKSERLEQLYRSLPFEMTAAQKKVVKEIRGDMRSPSPMNRLLQGDVGSGKTLVAVMAMLIAVDNGKQAALMVPTEILAEQHFMNISKLLQPLGVKVSLITGSSGQQQRKRLASDLSSGEPHVVIGTHALIQGKVHFPQLGLIIIDEQHRFGVMQRGQLIEKGMHADVLVMTATPIPRTLALTAYGSLDVSVIDEMPAGRKPITTVWRFDNSADKIYQFVAQKVEQGQQAYIVYPLVEESEKLDLKAATEGFEHLRKGPFKNYKVGLLHGRMKGREKEAIMSSFMKNEIQILVSTTVIEVGVDVANATIILIEHAERFGLAQLHQLRGRIGRGSQVSYCILKTPYNIGDIARERMKIMTATQDGFEIAEKDLELRGWGDFFGTRQSGMPEFLLANPITDRPILEQARKDAFEIVRKDPFLRAAENQSLNRYVKSNLLERYSMINIS